MQYKFRGKRIEDIDIWIYGDLVNGINGHMYIQNLSDGVAPFMAKMPIEVHPDSVGMWTGYKTIPNPDAKDVYEGDLFHIPDYGVDFVFFKNGCWWLGDELLCEFDHDGKIAWGAKLIGNTTDNKELLDG